MSGALDKYLPRARRKVSPDGRGDKEAEGRGEVGARARAHARNERNDPELYQRAT